MSARGFALVVGVVGVSWLAGPGAARADELPANVHADRVNIDVRSRALEAYGVTVDATPFHLASDHVDIRRSPVGIELDGTGKLTFCPCLGAPLALSFRGATVAPPYDVVVKSPRLELFGVPVFWAPLFWMRTPARPGLLPPDVQYRASDGLFLGEGLHLPWRVGDAAHGLDVRAGAYLNGGAAVDARLYTASSSTHLRWDYLEKSGILASARGAAGDAAWEVDALRGERAVRATTDVEAAARPFDRSTAEISKRAGGFTVSTGVRAIAVRGGPIDDVGAAGPFVRTRIAEALGGALAYDATMEGAALRGGGGRPLTYARAEGGTLVATHLGPLGASMSLRGIADAATDGIVNAADLAGSARASIALPLVRAYRSADRLDPWLHRIDPRLEFATLGAREGGVLGPAFGRGALPWIGSGAAWTAGAALANGFGRWGSSASGELTLQAGAAGDFDPNGVATRPLARVRAAMSTPWIGLSGESAHVFGAGETGQAGHALLAQGRLGPRGGLNLTTHVATRYGVDPVLARVLTDAPLDPSLGFFDARGTTGGARLSVPWGHAVTTSAGALGDLEAERIVGASGSIELRDRCECLVVRLSGAHRIGREGVDVWLTIDLAPRAARAL